MAAGSLTSLTVEIEFTAGVWTDVTSRYKDSDGIDIHHGRQSEFDDVQASTLSLTLENHPDSVTGIAPFTPDNPLSPYYPNVVKGKRIRVKATKAATWQRFIGRIDAWTPNLTDVVTGSTVSISASDKLADYEKVTLLSWWAEYVRGFARNLGVAWSIWPLDDTESATTLRNLNASGPSASLVFPASREGSAKVGPVDGLLADGMLTLTRGTTANRYAPYVAFNPAWSTNSVRLVLAFRTTDTVNASVVALYVTPSASSMLFQVTVTSSGFGAVYDSAGALVGQTTRQVNDGQWHTVSISYESPAATSDVYIDDELFNPTTSLFDAGYITVGGKIKGAGGFQGDITALATVEDALTPWTADAHLTAGVTDSGSALTELLRVVDPTWVSGVDFAASGGGADIAFGDIAGMTLGSALARLAATVGAVLWVDPITGLVTWIGPGSNKPITATATLTIEQDDDASIGQSWTNAVDGAPTRVLAKSPLGDALAIDTAAEADGTPIAQVDLDTFAASATAAADPAYARLNQSTRLRLSKIGTDLVHAVTDLYTALLGSAKPGMRLTVAGVPSGTFGYTSTDVYAQGWTEHYTSTSAQWTFDTTPADAPPEGRFDDATYSRFAWGDDVATLTSGITSSATSVSVTWASAVALSTSAGDYPLDLNVGGERVRIASAPAGGTSPRTLTVTRGVAPTVARAHSAGEPVEVWNAATFAF